MNEKEYDEQMEKLKQVGMITFVDATDKTGFMPVFVSLLFKHGMTTENVVEFMLELGQTLEKEGELK